MRCVLYSRARLADPSSLLQSFCLQTAAEPADKEAALSSASFLHIRSYHIPLPSTLCCRRKSLFWCIPCYIRSRSHHAPPCPAALAPGRVTEVGTPQEALLSSAVLALQMASAYTCLPSCPFRCLEPALGKRPALPSTSSLGNGASPSAAAGGAQHHSRL